MVNVRDRVNLLIRDNVVARIEFDVIEKTLKLSNEVAMPGFYRNGYFQSGAMIEEDVYMLIISDGYYCLSYKNDILQDGYPDLNTKVKQYERCIEGLAKTGGRAGEEIQVYVPTSE